MHYPKLIYLFAFFSSVAILCLTPGEAIARAGGGRSGDSGIIAIILWPIFAIYTALVSYYATKKHRQSKELLAKISKLDSVWDLDILKARIYQAFFEIQHAWRDQDQSKARDFMSDALYQIHQRKIDDMARNGTKNVMKSISLDSIQIIEILDYSDDTKDTFHALIAGSMIDYLIHMQSGKILDGDQENRSFRELWKFKRESHGWVLDEIDSKVSFLDVTRSLIRSEEID